MSSRITRDHRARAVRAAMIGLGALVFASAAHAQRPSVMEGGQHAGLFIAVGARVMPILRLELFTGGDFTHGVTTTFFAGPVPSAFSRWRLSRVGSMQVLGQAHLDLAPLFRGALGRFNPYVMAGLGISINRASDATVPLQTRLIGTERQTTDFAWTVGAGIQVDATLTGRWTTLHGMILDIGYRYLDAGAYRWRPNSPAALTRLIDIGARNTAHQLHVGLIIPFDRILGGGGWNGEWSMNAGTEPLRLLDPRDHLYGRFGIMNSWPRPSGTGPQFFNSISG